MNNEKQTPDRSELLPCPFCGAMAEARTGFNGGLMARCFTPNCVPSMFFVEQKIWNTRAASTDAVTAERRRMAEKPFYLIEKGQPGGIYWFKGLRSYEGRLRSYGTDMHPFDSIDNWPDLFTENVHEAIQFSTEADAQAVWRILPDDWKKLCAVTEHGWIINELREDKSDGV